MPPERLCFAADAIFLNAMNNTTGIEALSVTALNEYIKTLLDTDDVLAAIAVRGEISNFKNHYQTGHFYFTLKDDGGCIAAVMFRSYASRLDFVPENGMKAVLFGHVSSYVKSGQYQIYVTDMIPDGAGALYLRFEQLKARLEAEGLFDASKKKPIPKYPERIGIVTSPTGAAIQDILNILGRRFSYAGVTVYPALVQGAGAAATLCAGIEYFNSLADTSPNEAPDVIIIGRGGGSIEDLWQFNDEGLARTIAGSRIPVISAVGHETDFTIADFAADLRAPTPSAAAEQAVPDSARLLVQLSNVEARCRALLCSRLERERARLAAASSRRSLTDPLYLFETRRTALLMTEERFSSLYSMKLKNARAEYLAKVASLEAMNPLAVLSRGYAAVRSDDGRRMITDAAGLEKGDRIRLSMRDGDIAATVDEVLRKDNG